MEAVVSAAMLPALPDGRLLLLYRKEGTWDPPGGRLAPDETFEQAAVREVYEETGLLVAPIQIIATWVGEHPEGGPLATVSYLGYAPTDRVRLSPEHADYRWATLDEWLALPSWWSQKDRERLRGCLPPSPAEAPHQPETVVEDDARVVANLGAGTVPVDFSSPEPRALLLRRRKNPVGLWENPGGMLESGEDFAACARRETLEETGLDVEPGPAWWARIEPWRGPHDRELYAGVGFVSPYSGGEVTLEDAAHDACIWATEEQWRSMRTWYTLHESDVLWNLIRRLRR